MQNERCLLHVIIKVNNKVPLIIYINFSLKSNFVTKHFLVLLICCVRTESMSSCSPFIFRESALFPNCKNMNIISKLHLKFLAVTIWLTNPQLESESALSKKFHYKTIPQKDEIKLILIPIQIRKNYLDILLSFSKEIVIKRYLFQRYLFLPLPLSLSSYTKITSVEITHLTQNKIPFAERIT